MMYGCPTTPVVQGLCARCLPAVWYPHQSGYSAFSNNEEWKVRLFNYL